MSENGWTDDFLGSEWFQKSFIPQATARNTSGKPILLILDGHGSHETVKIIDLAISHGIIIFCLPPHTTHKLQPLDVGVFGPFSRAWADRCDEIVEEMGEEMPREDFVKEYMAIRAATFKATTIRQAFRKSGTYPVDVSVFQDDDFAPSESTSTVYGHVPASYPSSMSTNDDNNFYNSSDDDDDDDDIPIQHHDDDSDSDDSDSEDDDDSDSENGLMSPSTSTTLTAARSATNILDPFGLLRSIPQTSSAMTTVPPSRFYATAPKHQSAPTRSTPSVAPTPLTTNERLTYLEKTVLSLTSEVRTLGAQCAMAKDEVKDLKRKLNARENKARKCPKLNADARCLTSAEGRQLAMEHEAAKAAEQQKKTAARERRAAQDAEREQQRRERDPNQAFSGSLSSKNKPDLQDVAHSLQLDITGTKKDLVERITAHFDARPEKKTEARYEGIFNPRRRPRNDDNAPPPLPPPVQVLQSPLQQPSPFANYPPLLHNAVNFSTAPPLAGPSSQPNINPHSVHPSYNQYHNFSSYYHPYDGSMSYSAHPTQFREWPAPPQ